MIGRVVDWYAVEWIKNAVILEKSVKTVYLCIQTYHMKLAIYLIGVVTAIPLLSHSQDTAQLKRTPYKLIVAVDKHNQYEQEIPDSYYMLPNNTLQIYPGEKVFIEVGQQNGVITSMTAVKENMHPEKTVIVEFSQTATKGKHEMMMLNITNPFAQTLAYKAKMFLLKSNKWARTDVLAVMANGSGFETWPDIILSLALDNWQFAAK